MNWISNLLKLLFFIKQRKANSGMKTIRSSQESRYRSVKYRLNRDISLSVNQASADKKILMLPSTTKYSQFKARRNYSKFSVSNISDMKTTFLNCQSPQQQKMKKSSYMDTFHLMLSMQRNRYNAKQKDQESEQQKQKQKAIINQQPIVKLPRVQLPVLNQLDSHFTVLDNVNLPISYINDQIGRVTKQMADQAIKVKKIACQIKEIQKKYSNQIDQIQKKGVAGFEKLRSMLKANRVYQQQTILKNKSAFEKCRDYLPQYMQSLEESKQKLKSLQDTIFKGVPFELQQQKDYQFLSSNYF